MRDLDNPHPAASEPQLQPILKLKWVRRVARRIETEYGIRWKTGVRCPVYGVQIGDVDSVKQVEEVASEFRAHPIVHLKLTCDPQIKSDEGVAWQGIASKIAGPVRQRIAVEISVRSCENVEPPAALRRDERAELEVVKEPYALRNLADECHRKPVRHALTGDRALITDVRAFRQVRQISNRIGIVDGFRIRIASVEAETSPKPLFHLQRAAMVNRKANVIIGIEVSELRKYAATESTIEDGLARRQGSRLDTIEDPRNRSDL